LAREISGKKGGINANKTRAENRQTHSSSTAQGGFALCEAQ